MRPRGRTNVLLAAVLLLGCGSGDADRQSREEFDAEVEAFLVGYINAISARDTDQVRGSLVEDGRFAWLEDGAVRYRSLDDLLSSLDQFPPDTPIRTDLSDVVVVPVGDTGAHAWAQFQTTVGEGARSFAFGGAISFVLERRGDSWTLVGGHTSAPRPR